MSDIVRLLEALACDPRGSVAPGPAAAAAPLSPDARSAVSTGDIAALHALLGTRAAMACLITAPENDEPQRDDEPDDEPATPEEEQARAA